MIPATVDLGDLAGLITAVGSVIAVIVASGIQAAKTGQELQHNRAQMVAMQEKTDAIHHEVLPNSGGSMADAVNRTEARSTEQSSELLALKLELKTVSCKQDEMQQTQRDMQRDIGGLREENRQDRHTEAQVHQRLWEELGGRSDHRDR